MPLPRRLKRLGNFRRPGRRALRLYGRAVTSAALGAVDKTSLIVFGHDGMIAPT